MRLHFLFSLVLILFANAVISSDSEFKMETLAEGLDHAWGIAVVSDNEILVTEGVGRLRRIIDGQLDPVPIKGIPSVFLYPADLTQGGLCDVALHPRYNENQLIYLSFGEADKDDPSLNAMTVIRGRLEGHNLVDVKQIFKAEPPRKTAAHYGARILFLGDGTMLITSGDGFNYRDQAQTLDNHVGKIVRLNDDGSIPDDNPFVSMKDALPDIWSFGHRNPTGMALGNDGMTIFEHEHGPQGGDELNIVNIGKNYGWPLITYGLDYSGSLITPFTESEGLEQPVTYWTPSIAPSALAVYRGEMFPDWKDNLFVTAMVPGDLRRLTMVDNKVVDQEILLPELGRLRNVVNSTDGSLLVATDGPDGKIIRLYKD